MHVIAGLVPAIPINKTKCLLIGMAGTSPAMTIPLSGTRSETLISWRTGEIMAIIDIKTEITGSVSKVLAKPGQKVAEDEAIIVLESMKMEIPVSAPESGTVKESVVARLEV
jgi:acetyl-CoA carboxylase biotin carboxyl carrier protein